MTDPHLPPEPGSAPDFRHMTAREIREGIGTLSGLVRDLRRFRLSGHPRVLSAWREGTEGAARAAKVLPSAALVTRLGDMGGPVPQPAAEMLGRDLLTEAETLQRMYKDVWRARPGQKFRDVAARIAREKARRREKSRFRLPKFGK